MTVRLKVLAVWAITAVLALNLFLFGLSYPLQFRVLGDVYGYLAIADKFDGFSAAFAYAGERTAGLPIFGFAIRKFLGIFGSTEYLRPWVNAISMALVAIHLASAWFFSLWARRTSLVKSENAFFLLFVFLATYPALIGHTTTALSDTLAIDLILCAVALTERALSSRHIGKALLFSGLSALFFGFSILVRPGSLLGVAFGLIAGGAIALFAQRHKKIVIAATMLGCLLVLAPFYANCTQKYGTVCLQSPKTFDAVVSAQAGLRGARLLWQKQSLVPGQIPVLADDLMFTTYFTRCRLSSIVGVGESSWTGCLASRPLSAPVLVLKKWIGLFDHFRFTPYLEEGTPFWLRWMSRAYASLAWIGLALSFVVLFQAARRWNRAGIKETLSNNITPVLLVCYSMLMLAQHTVMHIEDRYGFPVVPLCAVVLFGCGEWAVAKYRSSGWRSVAGLALYCALAWGIFITQIVVWDNTAFY